MKNEYLKYCFKIDTIILFIVIGVVIGFNGQNTFLLCIGLILATTLTGEYLKLSNMMRETREKAYKNISRGLFCIAGILTLANIILEKIINVQVIITNSFTGIILIYCLILMNLYLGARLSIFTEESIKSKSKKKSLIALLLMIFGIMIFVTLIFVGVAVLSDVNARLMLGKYKIVLETGMILLSIGMSLFLNNSMKRKIFKKQWS